ncbi:MAG: TonB-dependent receptor [Prevotellaceae bacterium]|nr:TonB-dependent receptor [Prevotellaceae bacterium]
MVSFRQTYARVLRVLLLLVCLNGTAEAQIADSLAGSRLGEVRIKATKKLKTLRNAAPEQTLDAKTLEQIGAQSLSDAVRHMAGVTLHDYGGAGGLKTVSVRGLGAQFTGVSYDGVALSDIQTGQIDLQRYTLNDVQQVDLLIGDGNDIFIAARDAQMPALLKIRTLTDNHSDSLWHLSAQTVLGSWGYTNPMLKVSKRWRKLDFSALGDYIYAENDYPFIIYNIQQRLHKHRVNSMMNQSHAEFNINYRPHDLHTIALKLYYYDNDRQLPGIVRYYSAESKQTLREQTAFAQMQYKGQQNDNLKVKVAGKWNWNESKYRDRLYSEGIMDGNYWQREGYLSGAALWRPLDDFSVSFAGDFVRNGLHSRNMMLSDVCPVRKSFLNTAALRWERDFLSLSMRILHSTHLNSVKKGEQEQDYRHWSPSAGASLRWGKSWAMRIMWKDIFRMPSFNELYFFHRGASSLKPERTRQWNAGISWNGRISSTLRGTFSADGYINKVKDKIVCIPYNLFLSRNVNAAKVTVHGVDLALSLDYALTSNHALELQGHYSYISALDRSAPTATAYKKQIAYIPENSYSSVATWRNPWLNVSLTAYGVGKRWATNEHTAGTSVAGYTDIGATLFRDFKLKGNHKLTASFNVSNLLDKQHEVISGYPMPGIGWRAKVRWEW